MKILLHSCCAPCSIECVEALAEEGICPALFWYNPNIHPYTEYRARRDGLIRFAGEKSLEYFVEDEYGLRSFIKDTFPFTGDSENGKARRCAVCYTARLLKTAAFAAEKGYAAFSTTLLISPYQNHELIKEIAEELAVKYGVSFLYRDFRLRFRQGQNGAREAGYYMQKYCGCIYSEEERYIEKRREK